MFFLHCYCSFQAKLPSVLRVYRETLITAMKNAIKDTVAELLPVLGSRSMESDSMKTERSVDADSMFVDYIIV